MPYPTGSIIALICLFAFAALVAFVWSMAEHNRSRLAELRSFRSWSTAGLLAALSFVCLAVWAAGLLLWRPLMIAAPVGFVLMLLAAGCGMAGHYRGLFGEYLDVGDFWAAVRCEPDRARKGRSYWGSELPSGFTRDPAPTYVGRTTGIALGLGLALVGVILGAAFLGRSPMAGLRERWPACIFALMCLVYGLTVLATALRLKNPPE